MAKYNEIMNRIEVSEEMQSRVLTGVEQKMAAKRRKKQLRIWLPVAGIAVAAAVLLMIIKPWSRRPEVTDPVPAGASTEAYAGGITENPVAGTSTEQPAVSAGTEVTAGGTTGSTEQGGGDIATPGVFQETVCASAAELEKTAGFPVKELTGIPFDVKETNYRMIGKELAEANYLNGDTSLCFRKSRGIADNSGVYNEYSVNKKLTVAGCNVTLKGEGDKMILALWDDGTFSYSLYAEPGVSEDSVVKMIGNIMK